MRVLKTLAALAVLVALIVGVPALLIAWGDPVALLRIDWRHALLRPATEELVLAVGSVAGWLAWALLVVTSIVELVTVLSRGRIRIHLPGISWLQPVVGGMVAMVMTPVLSGQAVEPAPVAPVHAPTVAEQPEPSTASAPHRIIPAEGQRAYVVQPGDELWGVAERELGAGDFWRAIVRNNPGMTADSALAAGSTVLLPSTPAVRASLGPDSGRRVTVVRGDTLWDLAEEHLGDAHRWPEIFHANRDRISDPDEIDVGWSLSIPMPTTAGERPGDPEPEHVRGEQPTSEPAPTADVISTTTDAIPPSDIPAPTPSEAAPTPAPPEPLPEATDAHPPDGTPPTSVESTSPPPARTPATTPPLHDHDEEASWSVDVLGPVGGVLAASLFAGIVGRRRVQLLQRGVGRRVATLAPQMQRFFSALVQRSHSAPDVTPELAATSVIVGWRGSEDVHIDLERQRCTLLVGPPEDAAALAATIITSLLCAPWSSTAEVVTIQPQEDWPMALDDPRLSNMDDLEQSLTHLQRFCAQRRVGMGQHDLAAVRANGDRAGSFAPAVFVFCRGLMPAHIDRIRDCLSLGEVGVSVVAALHPSATVDDTAGALQLDPAGTARLVGEDITFEPQLLNQPARRAVVSLFASSLNDRTEPAPWWRSDDAAHHATVLPELAAEPKDDAMPAWSPHPDHPTLMVLGPVELRGCHGERPGRAVGQCMEYCAWLLRNPGATPSAMVRELLVAEGTRRSNTSRLRSWLGANAQGASYLPDAYSGRITLDAAVTSDWERFQALLAGGVNCASTPLLREALSLVRGRPLEGVAFQWPWVSQWLSDMLSMITDAAVVLADRSLTDGDLVGAHWAIDKGQLATGRDETLEIRRIHALALSGERDQLDGAIMEMTRAARAENRELAPETIQRIQHALHLSMSQHAAL
ncbi:MAG: LysM peptidoglycan-binding domain-containing protein [Arachnia sp.]